MRNPADYKLEMLQELGHAKVSFNSRPPCPRCVDASSTKLAYRHIRNKYSHRPRRDDLPRKANHTSNRHLNKGIWNSSSIKNNTFNPNIISSIGSFPNLQYIIYASAWGHILSFFCATSSVIPHQECKTYQTQAPLKPIQNSPPHEEDSQTSDPTPDCDQVATDRP